jgi:hypothetical protein
LASLKNGFKTKKYIFEIEKTLMSPSVLMPKNNLKDIYKEKYKYKK